MRGVNQKIWNKDPMTKLGSFYELHLPSFCFIR
jgi:hypothetical protein